MGRWRYALSFFGAAAVACTFNDPLPGDLGECDENVMELEPTPGLTYYADIQPILAERCGACHVDGGIAPFAFDTYATLFPLRDLIADVTASGSMPPWPPGHCCAEYTHDRSLREGELAAILGWVAEGAPEGNVEDAQEPEPVAGGLSRVDREITMPAPYVPTDSDGDEVRCFVLDWPESESLFITGLDVRPGGSDLVHHAIVYAVPSAKGAVYEALADVDDAPGWSCPGGLAEGAGAVVGGWVPGSQGYDFPEGLGRAIEPDAKIILSVHYNFVPSIGAEDQTSIAVRLDAAVDRVVTGLAVYNPAWLLGKAMKIPAGEEDVVFAYGYDPSPLVGDSVLVHNVSLHMHEHGSSGSLAIERKDGSVDCLLDIDSWDYNWQGDYYLKEPVLIERGDRIKVECHFDNSAANQPLGATPKDLSWGDDEEMCIATVLVAPP